MVILLCLIVLFWFAGNEVLTMATRNANARGSSVWKTARGEFFCALLFYAMAFCCILIMGEL